MFTPSPCICASKVRQITCIPGTSIPHSKSAVTGWAGASGQLLAGVRNARNKMKEPMTTSNCDLCKIALLLEKFSLLQGLGF